MRKQEIELLDHIENVQKNQIYLLETPKTPQQQFLHLFAHRHLLKQKMIHKNIDRSLHLLQGSFAQSSLNLSYITLCIQNQIEVAEQTSQLLDLIHGWVQFFPTIDRNGKIHFTQLILQDKTSIDDISGYDVYLHYINLISADLWKLLKKTKNNDSFYAERAFKDQYNQWFQADLKHLDPTDLLTFISSCLPKVLLNIILDKQSLPVEMRDKFAKFQCLFSNQSIEYYLRTNIKVALLLKQIFLALYTMELSVAQQRFLMILAIKYYYVFHFDRRYSAAQIVVFAFNKLADQARKNMKDQFILFLKIIQKLGKIKFITFLQKNSVLLKELAAQIKKKPTIGYSQDTAAPYNTIGVGETINLERGATSCRYFEILQQYSIFYYRILVKSLDITVKLYYMGEIASQKETKTLLLTQEKRSGEIKNCVNAMKKGIYMFQFDNSYSWINGKILKYENVIYSPLEIKSIDYDQWIEDFYQNIFQNIIVSQEDIYKVQKKLVPKQIQTNNRANISKKEGSLSLTVNKPNKQYEYETDNPERMEQKINSINKSKEQLLWTIENKPVTYHSDIQNYLRGVKISDQQPNRPKVQIAEKYEQSDEEQVQVSEEEYEVAQRQLQQSQIFNEATMTNRSKLSESESIKSEEQRKISNSNKQRILCNAEEAAEFYDQAQK